MMVSWTGKSTDSSSTKLTTVQAGQIICKEQPESQKQHRYQTDEEKDPHSQMQSRLEGKGKIACEETRKETKVTRKR